MKIYISLLLTLITHICAAQNLSWDSAYNNTYYEQKTTQHKLLVQAKKDIIYLGNSITDIAEMAELWQNTHIKNRGISSDITYGVLARLPQILNGKPAKIYLMIGINDISRNIPDSVIIANYKRIITMVTSLSPRTKLVVQSILPTNNNYTQFKNHQNKTEHILAVNNALKNICEAQKITYVNLYTSMVNAEGKLNPLYTNDGLHLTGAGYLQWMAVLKKLNLTP